MTLAERLRAAGCVFAEEEAALLEEAGGDLETLVRQRESGRPLEQILGWADFCGLRIHLDPGVFCPRQRSAFLVRLAVARPAQVVVDLCCGSGALGAAIAAQRPGITLHAADIDPAAVACARRNVPGTVHRGDLLDALPADLRGHVDTLVANAPYVPTDRIALMPPEARDHEPRAALDGGTDGLDIARRICATASAWLAPGGVLLIETSTLQAPQLTDAMSAAGLRARREHDEELGATVAAGLKP
jgi:release factor glutamine methyltransferase